MFTEIIGGLWILPSKVIWFSLIQLSTKSIEASKSRASCSRCFSKLDRFSSLTVRSSSLAARDSSSAHCFDLLAINICFCRSCSPSFW